MEWNNSRIVIPLINSCNGSFVVQVWLYFNTIVNAGKLYRKVLTSDNRIVCAWVNILFFGLSKQILSSKNYDELYLENSYVMTYVLVSFAQKKIWVKICLVGGHFIVPRYCMSCHRFCYNSSLVIMKMKKMDFPTTEKRGESSNKIHWPHDIISN